MDTHSLTTVPFHGASLWAWLGKSPDDTPVAMKPIVEGMGMDWGGQHKKLRAHPILAEGISVMAVLTDGGMQEMTAIRLFLVAFWLATIDTSRIKDPAIRDQVLVYQRECASALYERFFGQDEPKERAALLTLPDVGDDLRRLPFSQKLEALREVRIAFGIWPARQYAKLLGLPFTPAMEQVMAQGDLFSPEAT